MRRGIEVGTRGGRCEVFRIRSVESPAPRLCFAGTRWCEREYGVHALCAVRTMDSTCALDFGAAGREVLHFTNGRTMARFVGLLRRWLREGTDPSAPRCQHCDLL